MAYTTEDLVRMNSWGISGDETPLEAAIRERNWEVKSRMAAQELLRDMQCNLARMADERDDARYQRNCAIAAALLAGLIAILAFAWGM